MRRILTHLMNDGRNPENPEATVKPSLPGMEPRKRGREWRRGGRRGGWEEAEEKEDGEEQKEDV